MLLLKWILDCKSKNKRWRVCWSFLPVLSHAPPKSEQRCVSRIIQRAWSTNYIQELSSCIGPVLWVTAQLQRKSWQLQCVTCLWGSGWIFCIFGGQASAMFRRATGMQCIQSKAGNTTWKVWVMGRSSVPHLVSLCLQLSHLVLDHSILLLVHVTVQGQLLHLQAQALLLIQELNAITHTSHQSVIFKDIIKHVQGLLGKWVHC